MKAADLHPVDHAQASVDLDAIAANAAVLAAAAGPATLMAVVKADGYGHGAAPVARAALAGGAARLGVATLAEATALREAGITAPILAWLWIPGEDLVPAVAAGVEIAVHSIDHLNAVLRAAATAPAGPDTPAGTVPIHLKVDTGMGRGGSAAAQLPMLGAAAAAAERDGRVAVRGIMSHLANADDPADPSVDEQRRAFERALDTAREQGLRPRWQHLANTAATLSAPATHYNLVRCGIGLYGLNPLVPPAVSAAARTLRPAMTLRSAVALVKRVPAGQGVGYGLTYHTSTETTLALVPVGYADGIPRCAGNVAEVLLAGRRRRIAGRVAMDQVVLDCGDDPVAVGDEVVVFSDGADGAPTADDWGRACGTINYEIVTRIGPRVPRGYHRSGQWAG